VHAPVYNIMVTDVGGEARFAASAAKRLQQLGALLKADRRAMGAGSKLKEFDVDNQYGAEALKQLYHELILDAHPLPGLQQPKLPGGVSFKNHMKQVRGRVHASICSLLAHSAPTHHRTCRLGLRLWCAALCTEECAADAHMRPVPTALSTASVLLPYVRYRKAKCKSPLWSYVNTDARGEGCVGRWAVPGVGGARHEQGDGG
jgi:hypothetical protein